MKKALLIPFIAVSFTAFGQGSDAIVTDRPTQSASAFVVPQGKFLLETGFLGERVSSGFTNTTFLNALFRMGLVDGVELRITQNYVGRKVLDSRSSGLSPITFGTKIHLMSEDDWKPQVSLLGQVTLPTGSNRFKPDNASSELRLNFQNSLSENFTLGYNLGYVFVGGEGTDDFLLYSVVLGVGLADGWSVFIEPYGFFGDETDQRINAGVIYLAKPNLQFDISFGSGISQISPDSFFGFGASFGLN